MEPTHRARAATRASGRGIESLGRLAALIPAFREERHIGRLVKEVAGHANAVYVVDDGSGDQTGRLASEAGARLLTHERNCGKGDAIRTGLARMLGDGFEWFLLLDSDYQHLPSDIPGMVATAQQTGASLIIGARSLSAKAMPLRKRVTNWVMSAWISLAVRQRVPDSQCGFRLFDRRVAELLVAKSACRGFDIESEMILLARREDLDLVSSPITVVYGTGRTRIRLLRDTLRFFRLMMQ